MSHEGILYARPTKRKADGVRLLAERFVMLEFIYSELKTVNDYRGWSNRQQEIEKEGEVVIIKD